MSRQAQIRAVLLDGQHNLSVSVGIRVHGRAILANLNVPERLRGEFFGLGNFPKLDLTNF